MEFATLLLSLALAAAPPATPATPERLDEVAASGARVMPFDLERTTHGFDKTADGGVQRVVAKDAADARQIALIRAHLREIAAAFAAGDFGDPASIHGEDMPGLAVLREAEGRLSVTYADERAGGRIDYTGADADVRAAIHAWFDAQLADHARHVHH